MTAFPDAETIAASWDPALARAYGQALGAEAAGKGFDWLLAPMINIVRTPKWGREAETGVWTGTLTPPKTGLYRFSLKVAGVAQLYLNGHLIVSGNAQLYSWAVLGSPGGPTITFQGLAPLTRNHPVSIRVQYATGSSIVDPALQLGWQPPDPSMPAAAVRAAKYSKVAIVFANDVTSEGMDRPSLELHCDQDRLIEAVAAANPRTIIVLHTAGPVLMPWLSKVAGVLEAWYPGQQSATAIAATLFGDSDPLGHLPVTFPRTASQGPATKQAEYPGINNLAQYSEGIFVGYRYYDRFRQTPLFPFGYGLSYTSFSLSHLKVTAMRGGAYRATVRLRNTGRRAGAEVVQAYLQFPAAAGEPPRQLKASAKVALRPGGARTVRLDLARSSFEFFDSRRGVWTLAGGATACTWAPHCASCRSALKACSSKPRDFSRSALRPLRVRWKTLNKP